MLSIFNEERRKEIDEQRKGLSLASLFAKPRPIWADPVFVATFGDAFVENTAMEGNSSMARSFAVLNLVLKRTLEQTNLLSEACGFACEARTQLSDSVHVMSQSEAIFKLICKVDNESQLLGFLKKLKKYLNGINVGNSLLLPAYVEGHELALLLERSNERTFKVVVIQTHPDLLGPHAVSASVELPAIKYRTCMVLNGISKKNVLDDVFWLAVYNLKIHRHVGDTEKFYDVLLPFLTGKPLEVSLLDAETAALSVSQREDSTVAADVAASCTTAAASGATAAAASRFAVSPTVGAWRSPQRSNTAYVRLFFESLHFMLTHRGMQEVQANQVSCQKYKSCYAVTQCNIIE